MSCLHNEYIGTQRDGGYFVYFEKIIVDRLYICTRVVHCHKCPHVRKTTAWLQGGVTGVTFLVAFPFSFAPPRGDWKQFFCFQLPGGDWKRAVLKTFNLYCVFQGTSSGHDPKEKSFNWMPTTIVAFIIILDIFSVAILQQYDEK